MRHTARARLLLGLMLAATWPPPPAAAQASGRTEAPTSLLTMPPDDSTGERRHVTLVQVNTAGAPIGPKVELDCPRTGCETLLNLTVEATSWRFFANISMVSRGLYLTLEPRSIGIASVVEFSAARPGPTFLPFKAQGTVSGQIGFVIVRDASVREQERESNPNAVSNGSVFARMREPEILLQVDTSAAVPAAKPGAKTPP